MERELIVKSDCRDMTTDEIIEELIKVRNIEDKEHFFNPKEEDIYPSEFFKNIEEAGKIVIDGITRHKKFYVNCDSDTDGVMSGAIIIRYLKQQGVNPYWHISEGKTHGTSEQLIKKLEDAEPDILIVVDSLDSDLTNYQIIKDMGIQTVVLDHHDLNPKFNYDDVITLVSSMNEYPNPELSGAGVTWKFCRYLDELLGTFDSDDLVDLASTGIIADVMDVSEQSPENRAICHKGFKNLVNLGLKNIVGSYPFASQAVSFSVAPLINAACRYSENEIAQTAFITDDKELFKECERVLNKCKSEQKKEVDVVLQELIKDIEENQLNKKVLFTVFESKNGIAGLVAAKLSDRYQRPVFVVKEMETGYQGSCRSVGAGDFRQLCEETGLCKATGHPEAFGIFIGYSKADEFLEAINNKCQDIEFKQEVEVDAELDAYQITENLIEKLTDMNKITGKNYKPISVKVSTNDYNVTTMSNGKHIVCESEGIKMIQWNAGSKLEEFEEYELCGECISFIGGLEQGILGRNFSKRLIFNTYLID